MTFEAFYSEHPAYKGELNCYYSEKEMIQNHEKENTKLRSLPPSGQQNGTRAFVKIATNKKQRRHQLENSN